ncbi:retrovirus-related pol polyprotein from transposon TNT 1-94 [Tanacetum coccineum]
MGGPRNQDNRNKNQDSSRRTINVEESSSKAMVAMVGAGFDWSYMADDEVPTNMALMAFLDSEFNKSEFNLATYKRGLASVEEQLIFYKKNEVAPKEIMGPPPVSTPGFEKNVSFQKSTLGPRTKHIIVNNVKVPVASDNEVKQFYKPLKPTLYYFRVFGSKCFILNTYLTKFDPKSYEGVFLGYSENSKSYIILNKHTRKVAESLNVTFDETPPPSKTSPLVDDDLDEEEAIKATKKKNLENDIGDETLEIDKIVNIKESRNHSLENFIGNLNQRTFRSQAQNQSNFFCFISTIEPKNVNKALMDDSWIVTIQGELNQFIANDTSWTERTVLYSRNKTGLVAKATINNVGIDYDETYVPVARLESIRILLAYACALEFKLFQMDAKSVFLNGFINEEVYVAQPKGFINFEKSDHVYKLKKALYGLKQALKACYACSDSLLLTPLCCDDIHDVTPRVFALAGCDRLVSEPLVIEKMTIWNPLIVYGYALLLTQCPAVFMILEGTSKEDHEVHLKLVLELLKKEKLFAYLLRRVESRIRLCTHAKRQGRERDSRNAAWPGPTNGKEGRWRYLVHSGADKTYYDLRDMYGGHVWRRILLPIVEVGDKVMLEVSSSKDVVHFGKKEMLAPRYVGPLKYLADTNLHVHLEEIKVDKTLRFVEEPVEIIDREVKSLKRSRIPIVKSIGTRSEVIRIS